MKLSDGALLLLASGSLFFWGVLLGRAIERHRPGGVEDLREQRDRARDQVTMLRRAFGASSSHPSGHRPTHLRMLKSGGR